MGGLASPGRRISGAAAAAVLTCAAVFAAPAALAGRSPGKAKDRPAPAQGQTKAKAKAEGKSAPAVKSAPKAKSPTSKSPTSKSAPAAQPAGKSKPAGNNPPGNNGTFKVDGLPYDEGHDNEPHVTCEFRLVFWGFDEGQRGTIEIEGQAPSGHGQVGGLTDVLLSDDPAGGAQDRDADFTFTMDDLDLSGLTPHPQQGYHLKVTVLTGEPGGRKHKVFWLEPCVVSSPTPTPTPTGSPTGTPTPTPTGSPTGTPTPTPSVSGTPTSTVPPTPTDSPSVTPTVPGPTVSGVVTTAPGSGPSSRPSPQVLGRKLTRPGGLALTGFGAAGLLLAGAVLVTAGTIALVAVRRRGIG